MPGRHARTSVFSLTDSLAEPRLEGKRLEEIGGKALGLARCLRFGARVPRSEVLGRSGLRAFLENSGLDAVVAEHLRGASEKSQRQLQRDHQALCRRVQAAPLSDDLTEALLAAISRLLERAPAGLAIRSSAVAEDSGSASFAGVFESYLGVRDPREALARLRDCWCALWSPRALRYQLRMGLSPSPDGMAVLLQRVVPASASGVIHTAESSTGNPWRFELHATRGLAIDLLSGSGEGESFTLEWDTARVLRDAEPARTPATGRAEPRAPAVSDQQAAAVAHLARELDQKMDQRLDIEWALESDRLWVIQARPLTALPPFFPETPPDMEQATWEPSMFVLPLRADHPPNLVTPLYRDFSETELWHRHQPEDVVLVSIWKQEREVHGHRYADTSPRTTFFDYFDDVADFEGWLNDHEPRYRERWEARHDELARIERVTRTAIAGAQRGADLVPALFEVRDRLWDLNSFGWSGPQALGWMCEALLAHTLRVIDPNFRIEQLLAGDDSYTFQMTRALQDLGRSTLAPAVREAFDRLPLDRIVPHLEHEAPTSSSAASFLEAFESLCWRVGRIPPSWRDRPPFWSTGIEDFEATAMHTIRSALRGRSRDVVEVRDEQRRQCRRAETELRERVARQAPEIAERLDRLLGWTRYWTRALNDRHEVAAGLLHERELIWQTGSRLAGEGWIEGAEDLLVLRRQDLEHYADSLDSGALLELCERRRREYWRCRRLTAPPFLGRAPDGGDSSAATTTTVAKPPDAEQESMQGTGIVSGVANGTARRVQTLDAELLDELSPDDILVLLSENAFAYANWHSLLTLVRGVVSTARPAHHLTQVARECGVPIVGYLPSVDRLTDGTELSIDGSSGLVRLL